MQRHQSATGPARARTPCSSRCTRQRRVVTDTVVTCKRYRYRRVDRTQYSNQYYCTVVVAPTGYTGYTSDLYTLQL